MGQKASDTMQAGKESMSGGSQQSGTTGYGMGDKSMGQKVSETMHSDKPMGHKASDTMQAAKESMTGAKDTTQGKTGDVLGSMQDTKEQGKYKAGMA
jgi:hypothetical protein